MKRRKMDKGKKEVRQRSNREGRRGAKEGGTNGYPFPAALTQGDSEANRQDATQSHKRFHVSDTHRGHGRVCIVCLDRTQETLRRQGH